MNTPIRRLAAFCMVLFLALLLNATYLQYVTAGDLNDRNDNRRARDAEYSRERGAILVADDPVAESVRVDDRYRYQRRYPVPFQYAHVTGFFSYLHGSDAIELTQNDILSGSDSRLFVDRLVDLVKNTQPQGGSVTLTIDPAAQQAAYDGLLALGEQVKGGVVALEPSSGKVLALVSSPSYDPRQLASHDFTAARRAYERLSSEDDGPLRNRASREILPPGSTFKLVTAAAALSGDYDPGTLVPGGAALDLPQTDQTLPNSGGGTCGGERITLTQALMVSCNVAFGAVGLDLGDDALREQAEKFGFNRRYFPDLNRTAVSVFPQDPDAPQTALTAIGQFEVAASPLQMAMVAAGIANGGEVMEPFLVDEVRAPDLSVLEKTEESTLNPRAVSPAVARELTQMMIEVVDQGTGTTAQIPNVKVAGKTGTAQSEADRPPYAWFVSFAPADAPEVAVAVLVEDAGVARDAISGSGLAAPIARSVMEAVVEQ